MSGLAAFGALLSTLVAAVPAAGPYCDAALWLASGEASFVTGVALPVDGGFTAR